jgi:uncharacterized membrane protein
MNEPVRNADVRDETTRVEAFSDGVFAIAATLLIIDVRVGDGNLAGALRHIWPSYVAYGVSFITIGIMWANHHTVMDQIARCNRRFLMFTVFLLMFIAFVPFPTRLIAEHLRDDQLKPAALAYGITMTGTAIFYNLLWLYARRGELLRDDADEAVVDGLTRSYKPGPWIYLGATLVAVVSPLTSVILFAAIALFYVVDSTFFARGSS